MLQEFLSKLQYLIGETGYKFLCSGTQKYSSETFQRLLELRFVLLYFYNLPEDTDQQKLEQYIDFFKVRYNFDNIPYINYPNRVTNILFGFGISSSDNTFVFSGVNEAPFNNIIHGRRNGQWVPVPISNSFSQQESDDRYYPLTGNPSNFISSETDPTVPNHVKQITTTNINNWNEAYSWGNHTIAGYATTAQLHPSLTLGTNTNGLNLNTGNQVLQLSLATESTAGAMSSQDKVKLNSIITHDPVSLGTANGLSLTGQTLSLNLATTSLAGAMSSADKIKLDNLTQYVHPTGFTNQPSAQLTGNFVISRILVNSEGHITGVNTRELNLTNVGITPSALSKTDDTNVTLTLGGSPTTALLQATSLTLGWTGELAVSRGGTGNSTLSTGQVLVGNGTNPISTISRNGIDTRTSFPAATHSLTSHSDVNITSPQSGQVVTYNGTTWVNSTLELNDFNFNEEDPLFTAFVNSSQTANRFYASPNGSNGTADFRAIVANDIPNVYVRFDIQQSLSNAQATRVRNAINAQPFGSYELAFTKGNVVPAEDHPLSITNGTGRIVGLSDLIISHTTSGWEPKTSLTGKDIISNITVDEFGHISDWETRELTLDDLGYEGFEDDINNLQQQINDIETEIQVINNTISGLQSSLVSDKNFVHLQGPAATVWTIEHNLNKKPSVTIIDSAGSIILAKLTYIDLNNVEIDFDGVSTSGEAIFN